MGIFRDFGSVHTVRVICIPKRTSAIDFLGLASIDVVVVSHPATRNPPIHSNLAALSVQSRESMNILVLYGTPAR